MLQYRQRDTRLNRTLLELKYRYQVLHHYQLTCLNRTLLELKYTNIDNLNITLKMS